MAQLTQMMDLTERQISEFSDFKKLIVSEKPRNVKAEDKRLIKTNRSVIIKPEVKPVEVTEEQELIDLIDLF